MFQTKTNPAGDPIPLPEKATQLGYQGGSIIQFFAENIEYPEATVEQDYRGDVNAELR